jgi:hypothetical protein
LKKRALGLCISVSDLSTCRNIEQTPIIQFAWNPSEKAKVFPANPGNVSTSRKRGGAPSFFKKLWQIQKLLVFLLFLIKLK